MWPCAATWWTNASLCVLRSGVYVCCCVQLNAACLQIHPPIFFFLTHRAYPGLCVAGVLEAGGGATPRTSCQFMAGPHRETNKQLHSHSHLQANYTRHSPHVCLWNIRLYYLTTICAPWLVNFTKLQSAVVTSDRTLFQLLQAPRWNSEQVWLGPGNEITLWISRLSLVKLHTIMKCDASDSLHSVGCKAQQPRYVTFINSLSLSFFSNAAHFIRM